MTNFRLATLEDYRCLHPDNDYIPPLLTHDGHITAVGAAHGRVIPVIGATRPPIYDVSLHPLDQSDYRIYADSADDVLAVILGEPYQQQLAACKDLLNRYNQLGHDDLTGAPGADLRADFDAETTILCMIRGTFAHTARARAQDLINTWAKQDSRWDALTDQERDVLERAADLDSETAPIGIVKDMLIPDPTNPGVVLEGRRGTWTADVALVLNEVDYYPWSGVPPIYSAVTIAGPDGVGYLDDVSELNLHTIHVANADEFLEELYLLDVLDVTIRPAMPVDPIFRDTYEETVQQRVDTNRAATVAN